MMKSEMESLALNIAYGKDMVALDKDMMQDDSNRTLKSDGLMGGGVQDESFCSKRLRYMYS